MLGRQTGTDGPGPGDDVLRHRDAGDLKSRLDSLPDWHPSSPRYQSDVPAPGSPDSAADGPAHPEPPEAAAQHQSGWDLPDIAAHSDRPSPADIRLTTDRREHILDGDATGGGHRHGTGSPGKTEFPTHWDDDTIAAAVLSVAREPDRVPARQNWNQRWSVRGIRDSVEIVAIVASDGQVWTAWPREGSPGVIKNQHEEG